MADSHFNSFVAHYTVFFAFLVTQAIVLLANQQSAKSLCMKHQRSVIWIVILPLDIDKITILIIQPLTYLQSSTVQFLFHEICGCWKSQDKFHTYQFELIRIGFALMSILGLK